MTYQPVDIVDEWEKWAAAEGHYMVPLGKVLELVRQDFDRWRDALVADFAHLADEHGQGSLDARDAESWAEEAMSDAYRHAGRLVRGES